MKEVTKVGEMVHIHVVHGDITEDHEYEVGKEFDETVHGKTIKVIHFDPFFVLIIRHILES